MLVVLEESVSDSKKYKIYTVVFKFKKKIDALQRTELLRNLYFEAFFTPVLN